MEISIELVFAWKVFLPGLRFPRVLVDWGYDEGRRRGEFMNEIRIPDGQVLM